MVRGVRFRLIYLYLLQEGAAILEGMSLNYYNSLPAKKVLIWGADESEGLEMAKFVHSRCALLLLVGKDAQAAEAAATEISSSPPNAGTCPPGVDPVVQWDAGDIRNSSYVLSLTARYESVLGGHPEIAWNFAT
mmetsp:Transcript_80287/g.126697  ORF Transcript_80287/g.126697 Transcript_80287/m.126697 type:complete len:134 (+) Transcript_80287:64-465(+)